MSHARCKRVAGGARESSAVPYVPIFETTIRMSDIESSLWSFSELHARITNGKWPHATHRLAGLAVILLSIGGASKQRFLDSGNQVRPHLRIDHGENSGGGRQPSFRAELCIARDFKICPYDRINGTSAVDNIIEA